jgi:hypothetical protein
MDRVVDLKFGIGEIVHHVIVELYASGNIILTDYKYEILAVLRTHSYGDTVKVAVHQIYPMLQAAELEANDMIRRCSGSAMGTAGDQPGPGLGSSTCCNQRAIQRLVIHNSQPEAAPRACCRRTALVVVGSARKKRRCV